LGLLQVASHSARIGARGKHARSRNKAGGVTVSTDMSNSSKGIAMCRHLGGLYVVGAVSHGSLRHK
jgi:hypothetical protein